MMNSSDDPIMPIIIILITFLILAIIYIASYIYFELKKPSKYEKKYHDLLEFYEFIIQNYTFKSENKIILSYLKQKNRLKKEEMENLNIFTFEDEVLSDRNIKFFE